MVKAARRAGRSLKRDLGEIEHLQVSLKGRPISSRSPTSAPRRCCTTTSPRPARVTASSAKRAEPARRRQGAHLIVDPSTHHQFPARHSAIRDLDPLQREGTLIAGVIYNPANEELYIAERGKGAFLTTSASRRRPAQARRMCDRVQPAAYRTRRS